MGQKDNRSIKVKYTFKVLAGLVFLSFVIVLLYWLFFVYEVRNIFAILLIIVFLVIPAFLSARTIPNEIRALIMIWKSDDPEALEKVLGDLREKERI